MTTSNNIAIADMMLESNTSTTVDWSDHDVDSSFFDPSYTYSNDKYSCVKQFYHIHLAFNYIIFLSGLACLVTRLIPASNKYNLHSWSGRIYILAMLWSTSASLLINNEGLPVAVLVSFVAVMGGLTIGWIIIIIYKQNMHTQATNIVQNKLIENIKRGGDNKKDDVIDLNEMMNKAKTEIVKSKTFVHRFFSFKSLHGILFFVSWMQIAGRIFNSGDGEFSCRSFPVYKSIEAPHIPDEAFVYASEQKVLKLMNVHDPNWDETPWSDGPIQWALLIIMASAIMAIIGGVLFSFFFAWRASRRNAKVMSPKETQASENEEEKVTENININNDSASSRANNSRDGNIDELSSSSF